MPAYKDKAKGTWYASFYYEDWTGKKEKKMKRGFTTKREALEWERTFLQQQTADLDMTFESFVAALRRGHERPYQGEHLGDERAYPLQEVGALLRQAEDERHPLQGGHGVAERNAELPGQERQALLPGVSENAAQSVERRVQSCGDALQSESSIPPPRWATWARPRAGKCCSGQRRSI